MVVLARLWPPVQSDQLIATGADSSPATSLSLSIYNLLLDGPHFTKDTKEVDDASSYY